MALTDATRDELRELADRYPQARSALIPMLHLVQSEEGYVSTDGLRVCAQMLGLTLAEVTAVCSFYSMFKRSPVGEHHVGVCINPLCGILGGDQIWQTLSDDLGVGNKDTTPDGKITIERIECQAACTNAPVVTVDWEFMDQMSVESTREVVRKLGAGEPVQSTRGPAIRSFCASERSIAGFDDGLADAGGNNATTTMLAGLNAAKERGMSSPDKNGQSERDRQGDPS